MYLHFWTNILCCTLEFWSPRHPGYEEDGAQKASPLPRKRVSFQGGKGNTGISPNVQLGCDTEYTSVGKKSSSRCTYLEVQTESDRATIRRKVDVTEEQSWPNISSREMLKSWASC